MVIWKSGKWCFANRLYRVKGPPVFSKKIILYLEICSSLVFAQAGDSIHLASARDTQSVQLGVLCIDKLPEPNLWARRGKGSGTGWDYSQASIAAGLKERPVYFVSVDGGECKDFSQSRGNCVPDLPVDKPHLIRIVDAQKQPVASFRFRFEPVVTAMHVHYYSFYNSWIVDKVPKRRIKRILGTANAEVTCAVCR